MATAKKKAPWKPAVGQTVFIRTVTHFYTGKIAAIDKQWISLSDAAWIADTGRFANALASGSLNEVEPFPDCVNVSLGAVVDVCPWTHALPRVQK